MISTRDLSGLPEVDHLRRLLQSLAMLDAIIEPEWESRYYSFNADWSPGAQMGSMRNGEGDDFYVLFNASGCFIKGFAHETQMTPYKATPHRVWLGVLDSVPGEFAECLAEPAFTIEDTTFCIWRRYEDSAWERGEIAFPEASDPDGSADLLALLDGNPKSYQEWAEEYYERRVGIRAIQHIYAHRPLTEAIVTRLNPDLSLLDLAEDIHEIGYPMEETS